ncbi:MAG: NGG1p interacting factor NIF3 [Gammaproteobacteria bacterium]
MLCHIYVYIPDSHLEAVKQAMFDSGAGRFQNYDQCAWQTLGQGQFRPLAGSEAFIGEVGKVETVEEYRVEMICQKDYLNDVIEALKRSHPYEEPAFGVIPLL